MAYKKFSEFRFVAGVEYNPSLLTMSCVGQTDIATIALRIVPQDADGTDVENVIASGTIDDLVTTFEVADVLEGLEAVTGNYDLWIDDTNIGLLTTLGIESVTASGMSWINPVFSNFSMPLLSTFTIANNSLLTAITGLSFTAAIQSVVITGNTSLPAAAQDTIIKAVWDNALTFLQTGKTLDLRSNDSGISAQSEAYLTALNDNRSFKWIINSASPSGSGTVHIKTAADLQTLAVNLAADAVCDNHIEAAVTHGWGTDIPTYQLVIPTMTKGSVANISNGAISFGTTNCNVCGVYFNESKALVGFYVDSPTTLSGDMKQLLSQEYTQGTPSAVNFSISDSGGTLLLTFSTTPTGLTTNDWLEVIAGSGTGIVIGNSYQISLSGSTVTINGLLYNEDITGLKFKELNTATEYTSTDIKHYYLDFTDDTTYATERAKLGNLVDLTDDAKLMPLVCNDDLMRIYYRSKIKPEDGIIAKTGFNSIGQVVAFTGNFDCKDYEIRDCHVFSALTNVGVIGYQDGVNTSGKTTVIKSNRHTIIGFGCSSASPRIGMIGYSNRYRLVNNSYSTGSINGTGNTSIYIGGTVGYNESLSQVNNSYSTGSISGTGNSYTRIGGIVGQNYNSSQVNNSYSTGSITGTGNSNTYIGGLVGYNNTSSQVNNSYSTGSISGVGYIYTWVGGIVGYNSSSSQVNNSYSTGSITGTGNSGTNIGGIVGRNLSSSQVNNSYGFNTVVAYDGASPLAVRGVYTNSSSFVSNCYQLGGDGVNETGYADEDDFKVKSNFAYTPTGLENEWNSTDAAAGNYDKGTVVKEGTIYYVSTVDNNTVQPSTDTLQASWQILGFDFINIWRMGANYPKLRVFLHWIKNRTNRMIKHLYFGA